MLARITLLLYSSYLGMNEWMNVKHILSYINVTKHTEFRNVKFFFRFLHVEDQISVNHIETMEKAIFILSI